MKTKANEQEQNDESERLRHLAAYYQQQGDTAQTIATLRKLVALQPRDAAALGNLGLMHHTIGDLEPAMNCYRQAIALEADLYQLHYLLGSACRDLGLLDQAAESLHEALRLEPSAINVLQELAKILLQQNMKNDAEKCLYSILELDPHHGWTLSSLGLLCFQQQRFDEALVYYKKALDRNDNDVDLLYNIGLTLRRLGNPVEALASYEKALAMRQEDAGIHYDLGLLYKELNDYEKAIVCFERTVALNPQNGGAFHNLGNLYHLRDDVDKAIACYAKAVDLDHHAAAAEHLLDSLAGKNRETAPPQYVIDVFDNYAERFEHSLIEELDYKVPELLRRMLDEEWDPKKIFPCGLDLGCGTGLSGLAFQSRVEQLTGIDLSEKMLQQAAAKGLYHALHCAELVDFLNSASTQQYDLVIAADVFTYIGNLRPLFKALPGRLRVDAALLFSTEHHANGGDYILRRSGRFSHGVRYIEDLARAHGFTLIRHEETDIRKDRGQWLRGDLYLLTRDGRKGRQSP